MSSKTTPQISETGFLKFWSELYLKPKTFFSNYFAPGKQVPYFYFAFVVMGIGYGIDRVDTQLAKYDLRGTLDQATFINNWTGYWIVSVISGLIGALIAYYVCGWFYNVRLKWSKGSSDIDKSRLLYLYSSVVYAAAIVVIALISMLIFSVPYSSEPSWWDLISSLILLFFIFYSVYVSYCGVITTTDADKERTLFWFLVLPMGFYALAYISVIILVFTFLT